MTLGAAGSGIAIGVLGGFSVSVDGIPVAGLATGSQRLLVLLALRDRTVSRASLAASLWPDVPQGRAAVTLRSALSRLDAVTRGAVFAESAALHLVDDVRVDLHDAQRMAHHLLDVDHHVDLTGELASSMISTLSRDLLPDWFDEWIVEAGEDWRHLRAAALEALAIRLLDAGMRGEAAGAARAAIRADPLRETPHGILIRVHLADGDQSNAIAAYESYRTTLRLALELEPTSRLSGLLDGIGNELSRR
ncbi:MAG: BTAD domain-containing putative transcriptional regulator [Pseudolysinimonas sp.]